MKTLYFVLIDGDAAIQIPYPMTEEGFETLLALLKLQKPALVPLVEDPKVEAPTP